MQCRWVPANRKGRAPAPGLCPPSPARPLILLKRELRTACSWTALSNRSVREHQFLMKVMCTTCGGAVSDLQSELVRASTTFERQLVAPSSGTRHTYHRPSRGSS